MKEKYYFMSLYAHLLELGLDMCRLDPLIKFVDSTLVSIHQRTYSYSLIHKTTFFFY